MKIKFKKDTHSEGPFKLKIKSDWVEVKDHKGENLFILRRGKGIDNEGEIKDISNGSLFSASAEMLKFLKDFALANELPAKEMKRWCNKQLKPVLAIIEKATISEVVKKVFYFFVTSTNYPMFLTHHQAIQPIQRKRKIFIVEAETIAEAKLIIEQTPIKKHKLFRVPRSKK